MPNLPLVQVLFQNSNKSGQFLDEMSKNESKIRKFSTLQAE